MRLIKFLFGLTVGAAVGVLLAPKSGRELREQLRESASGTLLPPPVEDYPRAEAPAPAADETSLAVAPAVSQEPFPVAMVDDVPTSADMTADLEDEAPAEAVVLAEPIAAAPAETTVEPETAVEPEPPPEPAAPGEATVPPGEDLLQRIEETRAAVQADLSEPFGLSDSAEPSAPEEAIEETPGTPVTAGEPLEELPEDASKEVKPAADEVHEELEDETGFDESEPSVEDVAREETDHVEARAGLLTEPAGATGGTGLVADTIAAEPPESPVRPWEEETDDEVEELVAAVEEPVIEVEEPIAAEPEPVEALQVPVLAAETPDASPPVEDDRPAPSEGVLAAAPDATTLEGDDVEQVDQAEMRRRIEETRSRLKAKAFDAMMTGESALLRNDTGVNPIPKGDDAALEPEIDSTIDESFSQEDV